MARQFKIACFSMVLFVFGFAQMSSPAIAQDNTIANSIEKALMNSTAKAKGPKKRLAAIRTWYESSKYNPVWIKYGVPSVKAKALVKILLAAQEEALSPSDYNAAALSKMLDDGSAEGLARLEIGLSRSLAAYGQHLNAGRVRPKAVNREIIIYPKAMAVNKIMLAAVLTRDLPETLRTFAPQTPRYDRMRKQLAKLRYTSSKGGWVSLPEGLLLKPGMENDAVLTLAHRLGQSGDIKGAVISGNDYNDTLVDAVKRFQARMGLEADGVVGPGTLRVLNTPVEHRIRDIELNMERRRWMQNDYGPYYIFVNLADQVLKLVKEEKTIHTALVQVGKPYHRTPVFSDTMEYLELNPYWNVPYSIATKEYLPKLKRNPGVLARQNIEVLLGGKAVSARSIPWSQYSRAKFPFRLRQKPGKKNALGRIKFMFPNKYNIYIHDTPSKAHFSRASRYFSHGCVRVKDPLALAEVILKSEGWTRPKIDKIIRSGKRTVKKLKGQIPVHVAYLTAWVNKDGSVHYRNDIYGRDKILTKALTRVRGG